MGGPGNKQKRLALLEARRADVTAKLAEIQENLKIIDHKVNVCRGRLAAGDADSYGRPVWRVRAEQSLPYTPSNGWTGTAGDATNPRRTLR